MRILMVNKFLYPKGGDAVYTLNLGRLLSRQGHEVMYWGMDHPGNPDYPLRSYFVKHVDYNADQSFLRQCEAGLNMIYNVGANRLVEKLIRRQRPDIVHLNNFAHQISPSIIHVFKRHNIPVVMTMHDYKLVCPAYGLFTRGRPCQKCSGGRFQACFQNRCVKNSRVKSLLAALEMMVHHSLLRIYREVDCFLSPSRFMIETLRRMGFKGPMEYLPNFLDVTGFDPAYHGQRDFIVYCGRLSHEKGLWTLVQVLSKMPAVRLDLIGDGPLGSDIASFLTRHQIKNIRLLGYMTHERLPQVIRQALFVVIPSECYENSPMSVLEAFAWGKPVIGADIGGIPELVNDGLTGRLFQPGDVDDLRDKIAAMISDPVATEAMGVAARKFVQEQRNAEDYYEVLMTIYRRFYREA